VGQAKLLSLADLCYPPWSHRINPGISVWCQILLQKWVKDGWLVVANTANRSRTHGLSAVYRQFIGNLTENQ